MWFVKCLIRKGYNICMLYMRLYVLFMLCFVVEVKYCYCDLGRLFEYIFVYKNKMWKNFLFVKYLFWRIGRLFEGSYLKYFEIEGIK